MPGQIASLVDGIYTDTILDSATYRHENGTMKRHLTPPWRWDWRIETIDELTIGRRMQRALRAPTPRPVRAGARIARTGRSHLTLLSSKAFP